LSHFDVRSSAIFAEPRARHASAIAGGFARTTDRAPRCCCGSISSLWFSNLHFAPCVLGRVRHAPLRPSRFTPVRPSHASRSLFGATFRYPCFVEPYHNRAAHPHCICRADRAATLMGFSHPSQCSPSAGPGVCDVTLAVCARPSPPFIPTCRYRIHIAPFVFTAVRRARLSEFAKQTPSTRASKAKSRATDCDATQPAAGCCCRRRAEPGRVFDRARPILPWALASPFGLIGCFFTARRRARQLSLVESCVADAHAIHRLPQLLSDAAIRSWVLRATARKDVLEDRWHPTRARSDLVSWPAGLSGWLARLRLRCSCQRSISAGRHPCRSPSLQRIRASGAWPVRAISKPFNRYP
jgi:hypothetical protein